MLRHIAHSGMARIDNTILNCSGNGSAPQSGEWARLNLTAIARLLDGIRSAEKLEPETLAPAWFQRAGGGMNISA
jgi:hypothetical protein